jgi:hypothetical protein
VVRKEKEKGQKSFFSPCKGASKAIMGEDGVVTAMISEGGGPGDAPATRGAAPADG